MKKTLLGLISEIQVQNRDKTHIICATVDKSKSVAIVCLPNANSIRLLLLIESVLNSAIWMLDWDSIMKNFDSVTKCTRYRNVNIELETYFWRTMLFDDMIYPIRN